MRASFELKLVASDITEAKQLAAEKLAKFLKLPEDAVFDHVTAEIKVSYPEGKTVSEIEQAAESNLFVVTVHASVKQNLTVAFGL
jgi:urease gamma subunit